jgi:hypothetical protein
MTYIVPTASIKAFLLPASQYRADACRETAVSFNLILPDALPKNDGVLVDWKSGLRDFK